MDYREDYSPGFPTSAPSVILGLSPALASQNPGLEN